jgi:hypothetical protein
MYATLRGSGKLGNARLVDKVQLMRAKQSPYLNYGNATVQEHDLGTLRMLKSNQSARKMQSLMHETLSLMDRPDKIHLVDYKKVRDDCQKLSNEGIQENHQRQERNGSIGAANRKIKKNMLAYTNQTSPNRVKATHFKKVGMDSCKGGLAGDSYEFSYSKKPVYKRL